MLLTSAPNETVSACRMFIRSPTFKIDLSSFMHFQRVVSVHPWKSACSDATKAMMTSLGNTHTHTQTIESKEYEDKIKTRAKA